MIISGIPYIPGHNGYVDTDRRKYGIAIHCTSNTASARGEAGYAQRRTDGVSAHFYVDDLEVVQSIDTSLKTGHAGSQQGNENAVSVEITGQTWWTRQEWLDTVCWDKLGAVLAKLCTTYSILPERATIAEMIKNPRINKIYGHNDMRLAWGGTTHTDPGTNFPWDHLMATIKQHLGADMVTPEEIAQIATAVWGRKFSDYVPNPDGVREPISASGALFLTRQDAHNILAALEQVTTPTIDQAAVDQAVKTALSDPVVLASIAANVADELAKRLNPA